MKMAWQKKTIGDVCEVANGGTPKTGVPEYWSGHHRWITPAEMGRRLSPYVSDTKRKLSDLGLRDSSARMLPPNSVILSSRAPIGHLVINTEPMGTNQGCKGLIPRSQIQHKFLYYYLSSIVDVLDSLGTGATFKELSGGKLKEVGIPVPPLLEQERIVELLDEAFAGIAIAKANVERNIQNARALFETHLRSVFTQGGRGWLERSLEEAADTNCSLSYGIVQPGGEYVDGMPVVRPTDLTTKVIRLSGLKRIDPKLAFGYKRTTLHGGELLLCVRGSTGVVSITSAELKGANVTRGIVPIRFERALVTPEFGFYLISSQLVQEQIREKTYGTALMQINIRDVRKIWLSFPTLNEQRTISAKLDDLSEATERLARIYEQKLAALDALKQSLLHQAFTGRL